MAFLSAEESAVYVAMSSDYAGKNVEADESKAKLVAALRTIIVDGFGRRGIDPWFDAEWARHDKIPSLRKDGIGAGCDELMVVFINGCGRALAELCDLLDYQYPSITVGEYRAYVKEVGKRKNGKDATPWKSYGGIKTMQNVLSTEFRELGFAQQKPTPKVEMGAVELAELFSKKKLDIETIVAALKIFADAKGNFVPASILSSVEADLVLECAAELLEAQDKLATVTLAVA